VALHQKALIDPEEIPLFLQKKLTKGRDLNIVDLSQEAVGETNYISADRDRIFETTFSQLKYINDFQSNLKLISWVSLLKILVGHT